MFEWLSKLWKSTPSPEKEEAKEPFDRLRAPPAEVKPNVLHAEDKLNAAPYEPPEVFEVHIGAELDLHTFSPKEVADVTKSYLEEAHQKNFSQVRIIHGKGKGVQRELVHTLLKKHPLVRSFQLAPPEQGGWGATLVWLTPKPGGGVVDQSS